MRGTYFRELSNQAGSTSAIAQFRGRGPATIVSLSTRSCPKVFELELDIGKSRHTSSSRHSNSSATCGSLQRLLAERC